MSNQISTLSNKSIAIIGLGAVGSITAKLLSHTEIKLLLIDHDIVQESNLQRQPMYDKSDVNKLKCEALCKKLKSAEVFPMPIHIDSETIKKVHADIILDCTDNIETRLVINEYCKKNNISWIHTAAAGSIGVVIPFTGDYCFRCVYGNASKGLTCDNSGILNTTSERVAQIQVDEALKIITGKPSTKGMIRFNGDETKILTIKKKECTHVQEKNTTQFTLSKCTTRAGYSAKPAKNMKLNLSQIKKKFNTLIETPIVLVINEDGMEVIVHEYGELLFKDATDETKMQKLAQRIYAR